MGFECSCRLTMQEILFGDRFLLYAVYADVYGGDTATTVGPDLEVVPCPESSRALVVERIDSATIVESWKIRLSVENWLAGKRAVG